jgi:hypothetical protein
VTNFLVPPTLALVRSRIAGFAALTANDQQRAAAFALKRDLGVDSAQLQLVARAIGGNDSDAVGIAFTTHSAAELKNASSPLAAHTSSVPVEFFDAMTSGSLHWYGAPSGFVIGPMGAALVEHHSDDAERVPSEVLSMLGHQHAVQRVVLINPLSPIQDASLSMWQAATGAHFAIETSDSFDPIRALTLRAPMRAPVAQPHTAFDRALLAACIVSVLCVGVAVIARLAQPVSGTSNGAVVPGKTPSQSLASGDLFSRIATVSPQSIRAMKSATFGGGAWVIALNTAPGAGDAKKNATPETPAASDSTYPAYALDATAKALRDNGLLVQTITQPEPRLRVSAP